MRSHTAVRLGETNRWLWVAVCAAMLLGLASGAAHAEGTVVFRAVGTKKVKARYVKRAENALARAVEDSEGATLADTDAGAAAGEDAANCAVEPSCLATAGASLDAARAVGILIAPAKQGFEITFVLVEVSSGSELARASNAFPKKDLRDRPGELLAEFLAAAPAPKATGGSMVASGKDTSGSTKPWAAGLTPEKEQQALEIFNEGNSFFEQSKYAQALTKYREAIKHWDHPAIRFNIAVCLVNLDQPVEAHEHLMKALQYGDEPLGAKLYADGLTYKKLLLGRLAKLRVVCKEPGTAVTLDGKELFVGPGEATRMLMPGSHQVVASKENFLARTESLMLLGGKEQKLDIEMIAMKDATVTKRRWKAWKPWAVIGSGAGVGLLGALLYWRADADFKSYDSEIEALCAEGCTEEQIPGPVSSVETRAKVENGAAIVSFALGGAALVSGVVLIIMNQPRTVPVTDAAELDRSKKKVTVTPVFGPGQAGFAASLRF